MNHAEKKNSKNHFSKLERVYLFTISSKTFPFQERDFQTNSIQRIFIGKQKMRSTAERCCLSKTKSFRALLYSLG